MAETNDKTLLHTSWDVEESDGSSCIFHFQDKGLLAYDSDGQHFDNGRWHVDSAGKIHIDTNDHYADYTGVLSGGHISGDAWNVTGAKWTWKAKRRK